MYLAERRRLRFDLDWSWYLIFFFSFSPSDINYHPSLFRADLPDRERDTCLLTGRTSSACASCTSLQDNQVISYLLTDLPTYQPNQPRGFQVKQCHRKPKDRPIVTPDYTGAQLSGSVRWEHGQTPLVARRQVAVAPASPGFRRRLVHTYSLQCAVAGLYIPP